MIEVLQFVFSSFWTWIGSVILIAAVSGAVTRVFRALTSLFWRG